MVTPGTAYFGDNQVLLDTNAMVTTVDDLNDLPIRIEPGNNVYLRDIGQAEDSYAIQTSRVRINGKPQVYVPIYRQRGASSLAVANGVKDAHPVHGEATAGTGHQARLRHGPVGLRQGGHPQPDPRRRHRRRPGVGDDPDLPGQLAHDADRQHVDPAGHPRRPIVCLYVTGNTINAMTLGGLALAIGPLVDDAIVALENNHRNYHLGKSRVRAALDGCVEVMVPVLVATCTTNIVLAPLALMPGMGGFLFRPLALAVAFAMIASFLLSRTFVPMMCGKFLPDEHRASHRPRRRDRRGPWRPGSIAGFFGRIHRRIDRFLIRQTQRYERLLALWPAVTASRCWRSCWRCSSAALCLFLCIGREFFPQVDAGQITMYVRAPSNLRLDATERRIAEVEKFIEEHIPADEREMIVSEMGLDPDWSAAYTANSGQQDAVIRIQLNEKRKLQRPGICHPAAARVPRRPALRRPARQLRHRRHGVHGAELRRLVADRRADRRRHPRGRP